MKNILSAFLTFSNSIVIFIKKIIWAIDIRTNVKIIVTKDITLRFFKKGEITKLLYTYTHLVRFNRGFEHSSLEILCQYLKPGSHFIDIGANIGLYSLVASKIVGNSGKIYSFEPNIQTFSILKRNANLNGCLNIIAVNYAVGNLNRDTFLSVNEKDAFAYVKEQPDDHTTEVKMIMSDQFVVENNITKIDFIKVDIEGAELLFFEGAKKTLRNFKPKIIFEAYEPFCKRFNYSIYDILSLLDSLGYKVTQFESFQWIAICKDNG